MEENLENTENLETPAVESAVEETTPADDVLKAETVFFVVKDQNGSFRAITNVAQKIELARPATLQDIRQGCNDLSKTIDIRQTAETVALIMASAMKKQSEEA